MSAIMQSVTKIKYHGEYHPSYTPFEVDDGDVDMMVQKGCHILKQNKQAKRISPLDTKKSKEVTSENNK